MRISNSGGFETEEKKSGAGILEQDTTQRTVCAGSNGYSNAGTGADRGTREGVRRTLVPDHCRDQASSGTHIKSFSPVGKACVAGGGGGHGAYHQRNALA